MYDTNETPTTGDSSRWRNYHQLMWTQQQLQMQLQQQQQQNHQQQQNLQLIHHHPQPKQQQQQQQEQQMQNQRMSALSIDCTSSGRGNGNGGMISPPTTSSSCAMVSNSNLNSTVTHGHGQQHPNHQHQHQQEPQQQSCSSSVPTPEKSPVAPSSGDKATPSKCDAAPSWENFDAQAAFLGPSLWDKRVPTDGQDFKLEYVDLEEFLTENGIPVDQQQQHQQQQQQSQNHNNHNHDNHPNHNQFHHKIPSAGASTSTSTSTSTATSASAAAASAPSPVGVPHHAPMGPCGSPTSMVHHYPGPSGNPHGHLNGINGVVNGQPPHPMMLGQGHGHTPIPSRSCSPCGSSVSWSSEESSQMGHFPDMHHHPPEYFDPRTRIFSEEELKPQPMIKKSKKQVLPFTMIPDDLKDAKYWARRRKNNMAAKRSRDARRIKENQIAMRTCFLEKENSVLKQEIDRIQKENLMLKNQLNCCQREH